MNKHRRSLASSDKTSKKPRTEADPPSTGAEDSVERRTCLETASRKKLAIRLSCPSTSEPSAVIGVHSNEQSAPWTSQVGTDTNLLVSLESSSQALSSIGVCKDCGTPLTLKHDLAGRGLAVPILCAALR